MGKSKILLTGFFLFYALYLAFHVGRYYEKKLITKDISRAYHLGSFRTDYIIPGWVNDYPYENALGRCFTGYGEHILADYVISQDE